MGAAGRRVKLDLFAEPSGGLGGSSTQDDVGGEDDSKNRGGSPDSPSSSGQQPQNPLLLLGQYSDDELEEVSKDGNSDDAEGLLVNDTVEQAEEDAEGHDQGAGVSGVDHSVLQKVEQFIMEMDSATPDTSEKSVEDGSTMKKVTNSAYDGGDPNLAEDAAPATSERQAIADASMGWKMVLHEESNQYYYWNVATGETSWEVPQSMVQATDSTFETKAAGDSGGNNDIPHSCRDSESVPTTLNCSANIIEQHGQEFESLKVSSKSGALVDKTEDGKGVQGKLQNSSGTLLLEDGVSSRQSSDIPVGNGSASIEDSVNFRVDTGYQGGYEDGIDFSSSLIKQCEHLLEQLKYLNRCTDEKILKCMVEVEIRMDDIKSLASHGTSVLPFWVHSQKQLEQLETTVNNISFHSHKDVQTAEIEGAHKDYKSGTDKNKVGLSDQSTCSPKEKYHASLLASTEVHKGSYTNAQGDGILASAAGIHTNSACDARSTADVNEVASPHEISVQQVLHSAEDGDMDVDMEVEDAVPQDESDAQICLPAEQPSLQNLPVYQSVTMSDQMLGIPPLPNDWIPPPPPDNEPYPPPPPDEPPEAPHPPPPGSVAVQTFSCTDQYNQSFPGSDFEYYGQNTHVPTTNFYAYSEGCQIAGAQPSVYYESVPVTYSTAPVMVSPVEPVYYALPDGLVHPASVCGVVESSGVGNVSGHKSFNTDSLGFLNSHANLSYNVPPKGTDEVLGIGRVIDKASLELPSSQQPATTSMVESVSVPSTAAVTASTSDTATATKGQSKVSRTKKRTVAVVSTSRSNKKVSSLVDKWKAAKEELHEDEEEKPETYLEKLEKKRQREIEEWRAQQIASGEAKDNANFQPLGGDWRERVKRRRAQLMNERERSPSDGATEGTQQPDLDELSKGLPSGWQAYWDDSSRKVYYGNAVTAETSWTRPSS